MKSSISFTLRLKLYFRCVHSLTCCDLRQTYHIFQMIEYSIGKMNESCEYSFAQSKDIDATYLTTKMWETCRMVWGLRRDNLTSNNIATHVCHQPWQSGKIWGAIITYQISFCFQMFKIYPLVIIWDRNWQLMPFSFQCFIILWSLSK